MNRAAFLARLRKGLSGLAQEDIDELIADYEAHFVEGVAAGRSEDDVARALGDPGRLARELRAEAGLRKWEAQPSPGNYFGAIVALIGLIAFDFILLLPLLLAVAGVVLVIVAVLFGIMIGGFAIFGDVLWNNDETMFGSIALMLLSLSMISGGVAGGALTLLALEAIMKLLASYARLHYRLLNQGEVHA